MLLLLVTLIFSFAPVAYERVDSLYDGDTILLNSGEKVRYLGIDAPEIGRKGEKYAYDRLSAYVWLVHLEWIPIR